MMTVKELIKELKKLPDDIPVRVQVGDSWRNKKDLDEVKYEGNHVALIGE